jgi:hypothetical protein
LFVIHNMKQKRVGFPDVLETVGGRGDLTRLGWTRRIESTSGRGGSQLLNIFHSFHYFNWIISAEKVALQRHNTKNFKITFPEKELHGISPTFHIHVSHDRSAYSTPGKYVDRSWEYINRSQTHECEN